MLGVFSSLIASPPDELVAVGCQTPSPKITSMALLNRFLEKSKMEGEIGDEGNGDSIIVTITITDLQI
ncbi:hypothetical protein SLE2022_258740 [Rubroshorea leprosula]